MATPKAVEDQERASDEALAQLLESEADGGEGAPAPDPEPQPAEPVAPVETPPAPVVDEAAQLRQQLAYEKHRNDSLQGRLESQLRPLNETVRDMKAHIATLEQQLQSRREERPLVPAHLRHLKPDEVEAMGRDAIDAQSRIARGVVEDAAGEISQRVEQQRQATEERLAALEQQRQEQASAAFWGRIEQVVPGAKGINEGDPRWSDFLNITDPLSGRLRRDIGESAMAVGDVRRVADLLTEFKGWTGEQIAPPAAPSSVAPPVPPVARPEVVRAAPVAAQAPAGSVRPLVIKESQIRKFYDDWARGKFVGRDDEANRISTAIDGAVMEGRVIPG